MVYVSSRHNFRQEMLKVGEESAGPWQTYILNMLFCDDLPIISKIHKQSTNDNWYVPSTKQHMEDLFKSN